MVMAFILPLYTPPDFTIDRLRSAPDVRAERVVQEGVAPANFHATTIYPEYCRVKGKWLLVERSRMDCAMVVREQALEVVEQRRLRVGDRVAVGRTENGEEGIYVHTTGFQGLAPVREKFAFRLGRTRETSYSRDYDLLYDLLRHERLHGYLVWVLGPAVVFDADSRDAMVSLIRGGYVHAILAGNALATHDLEAAVFGTALGQDIYNQIPRPNGHYHHLDVLNRTRAAGSIEALIKEEGITNGVVHACLEKGVPVVLAGSIRDDGPLPEVIADVTAAQDAMRKHTGKATTLIGLATQLHSIAAGNLTPSYQVVNGTVRPVYIYAVDVSEFAVDKLRDRGTLGVTSIVTNIQDFLVILRKKLVD
jgi:lysine-ketoglutarate reductase/saccharopine dehydrogenase-like protein (TIGR00300 family)